VESAFLSKIKDFRSDPSLFDYWKLMSDEEIKLMSKSKYAAIGSHGFFHNNLGNIPHHDAVNEVIQSKNYLENLVQYPVTSIAYPDGSYTRKIIADVNELGITEQLAVNYLYPEDANDNNISSRLGIYPFQSVNKLGHMIAQKKL